MKKYFFPLCFLFLSVTQAFAVGPTQPGIIPSLTVGGRVYTDLKNLLVFVCEATAANTNCTLRKSDPAVSAGYQVTTGKTLTLTSIICTQISTGANGIRLLYADNDVGYVSSVAFTNAKYVAGASSFLQTTVPATFGAVVNGNFTFAVPATKYPAIQGGAGAGADSVCLVFGYEQ